MPTRVLKEDFLFLFLDLETTGHDPLKRVGETLLPWHEIIEIGAVIADPKTLETVGTPFEIKIKPRHPERCPPDLINHYPTRAACGEWDGALSLPQAIQWLFSWTSGISRRLVAGGHNFFFDWTFMTVGFAWCGIDESVWKRYLHYTRFDTRSMAMQKLAKPHSSHDPAAYSLRNDRLAERLGIPEEPVPHMALNGAMQSYKVWRKLQEM